ncbi:unnamed protein product [Bursaphelenchus xylophilus]|uniref:(pine wood nematode) hypothetical protein n=1 Tax=Bursaphelenchus xylophilus TaxID=6326 RepID=A0A1I7S5N2_BURXY|nr:unnamed protein product [Bursaphelenchus xylophilus]CAG9124892.1 unnamed protein product [Bursaphelenchus xylophilus]
MFKFVYLALITFSFLAFIFLNLDSGTNWLVPNGQRKIASTKFFGVVINGLENKRTEIRNNTASAKKGDPQCILPQLDPWDAKILRYLSPASDLNKNKCEPTFKVRSYFENGILYVNRSMDEDCAFRCVEYVSDHVVEFGKWAIFSNGTGHKAECDVSEIECFIGSDKSYHYAHVNLVEKPKTSIKPHSQAHDVYVIIVDSISASSFQRALSATKNYLESDHSAIFFPHLNRVALNSRPNGYAFLLNERSDDLPESPWNPFKGQGKDEEICKTSVLNYDYIGKDFQKAGYRTLVDTDWFLGLFEYPDCVGFGRIPADHYLQPYQHIVDYYTDYSNTNLTENVYQNSCRESHHRSIETLKQFVNMYKDEPKFLISAFARLGHDDINNVFHGDQDFLNMFMEISDKLKNAFLILMSDHGLRFGGIKDTDIGLMEENNPALMISLPLALRQNQKLVSKLKENSKQHLSHYDIYATLLDIAQNNHKWTKESEFMGIYNVSDRSLQGSSLLRDLKWPRDCFSLQIPFDYCLCQYEKREIRNDSLAIEMGKLMVEKMNLDIKNSNYSEKCTVLSFDEAGGFELEVLEPNDDKRAAYLLTFKVRPSGGKYKGYARIMNSKLKLVSETFPRMDSYAKQAACIPREFLQNYCFCADYKE